MFLNRDVSIFVVRPRQNRVLIEQLLTQFIDRAQLIFPIFRSKASAALGSIKGDGGNLAVIRAFPSLFAHRFLGKTCQSW